MKKLTIIGFGNFAKFITPYLTPHFEVTAMDKYYVDCSEYNIKVISPFELEKSDIILFCLPVQYLEESILDIGRHISKEAIMIDVTSVKEAPMTILKKYFPNNPIIGTHPLFGSESGKDGIENHKIVVTHNDNENEDYYKCLIRFLKGTLKLNVLERTSEVHDKQMAYVQALTHLIGKTINNIDIPDVDQKTDAYQYLLNIKKNLGNDSNELFDTIQKWNPHAKEVRANFINELHKIDEKLY
jgi:prephenate dehydrogenase